MKIGILTQPLHANYGGLLQNYALQHILTRAGHEVETIDWGASKGLRERLYRMKMQFLATWFSGNSLYVRYQPSQKELSIIWRNTNHFIEKYIRHTVPIHSFGEFQILADKRKYEVYIVGSDQCWRPCYNTYLSSMFLDFTKGKLVKRLAYAASFGTDRWEYTPQQTAICASLAQNFDMVTVREDSGVKLCKEHLGVDAIHVLDPTMLLMKEDYVNLIEAERESKAAGTLFNYILDPDAKKQPLFREWQIQKDLSHFRSFQSIKRKLAQRRM